MSTIYTQIHSLTLKLGILSFVWNALALREITELGSGQSWIFDWELFANTSLHTFLLYKPLVISKNKRYF